MELCNNPPAKHVYNTHGLWVTSHKLWSSSTKSEVGMKNFILLQQSQIRRILNHHAGVLIASEMERRILTGKSIDTVEPTSFSRDRKTDDGTKEVFLS